MIDPATLAGLAGVPLITGLVQAARAAFNLDSRHLPMVAIGCGIGLNAAIAIATRPPANAQEWAPTIIVGVVAGLAASGLYDHINQWRK